LKADTTARRQAARPGAGAKTDYRHDRPEQIEEIRARHQGRQGADSARAYADRTATA
jgi:hypothetical protein